jgi:hypothetical protein
VPALPRKAGSATLRNETERLKALLSFKLAEESGV